MYLNKMVIIYFNAWWVINAKNTVEILTVPAVNVNIGNRIMLSFESGYFVQMYANIAIIAPDCKKQRSFYKRLYNSLFRFN